MLIERAHDYLERSFLPGRTFTSPADLGRVRLCRQGLPVSLSAGRTGQCWDNALSESIFASIKGELPGLQAWPAMAAARRAIVEYITWYNGTRMHSTLGYRSPAEFEEDNKIKKVA